MSDSTTVELYVLEIHEEFVRDHYANYDPYEDQFFFPTNGIVTQFAFYDINYGELPDLDILEEQGIPYTVDWGNGDEFSRGSQSLRFDDKGNQITTGYYIEDLSIPYIDLVAILKKDEPLTIIKEKVDEMQRISIPLPWDDQEENSKIYLTRKLIGANNECDSTEST